MGRNHRGFTVADSWRWVHYGLVHVDGQRYRRSQVHCPTLLNRETGVTMRWTSVLSLSAFVLLGTLLTGEGRFVTAQEIELADHPARGSWTVASDPGDTEYSPRLAILSADGGAFFVSGYQYTGVGRWEPTGETTAAVTFTVVTDGPAQIVIRAGIEVAPDGQSFTGTFTNEAVFDPAGGGTSGEIGPGTLDGTRLAAEAPGTPAMSFEEFFPQPEGTPEATPVP